MLEKNKVKNFIDYCRNSFNFKEQISYNYESLAVCIIDCVYSLRAKYDTVTKPVVQRYIEYDNNSKATVSKLIEDIEHSGGPELFAKNVLHNEQLSGHVLKAAICLKLAKYLKMLHIESIDDFRNFEEQELLEIVIMSVKGIGDAGTNYLFMLAGDQGRCKPDVHIHHCVRDGYGEDLSNEECQELFKCAVEDLKADNPELTVAKLDGIIWRKYHSQ